MTLPPAESAPQGQPGREIELKLALAPEALARLRQRRDLCGGDGTLGRARTQMLRSIYFDTPDCALRDAGIALRLREIGAKRIQTVKAAAVPSAGLSDRAECECAVDGQAPDLDRIPDPALRAAIVRLCDGAELRPLFVTRITRTAREIVTPAGERIELAFDEGEILAKGRVRPVSEIELELKAGAPHSLYQLARRIAALAPVRLQTETKAALGYALAEEAPAGAVKAAPLELDQEMRVGAAFQTILRACMSHLLANQRAVIEARDAEGVHQMRVALRRLRSAFSIFKPLDLGEEGARLNAKAKEFAGELGAARDLDVFIVEILDPVLAAFPGERGLGRLKAAAEARRERAYETVQAHLAGSDYAAFLLDLGEWIESGGWNRHDAAAPGQERHANGAPEDEEDGEGEAADRAAALERPILAFAREVLERRFRKVRKLGRRFDDLSVEERHEMRKRLKKLRYATDFLAGLFPQKETRRYLRRLSNLQDRLGYLNDAATAQTLTRELAAEARPGGQGVYWAAGLVAGWHGCAARAQVTRAAKNWKWIAGHRPFWRAE